ncbi:MAG TPA: O-antigen polymerase [Mucilaginibacter sp.]|nr:O-antigen polymerase [Mucilaginibacter sp.]
MDKKIKSVADVNPFFTYIIGFTIALIIYQLDWSYLFPSLTLSLVSFLILTFVISGFIGLYVHRKGILKNYEYVNKLNVNWIVLAITISYILNFIYAKQIPLFSIANNADIDYREFGIPTFYVILATFTSFFTVYLFKCYIVEKKRKYLFLCLYLFIFPILIFTRGAVLLNLSSIFFLYLFSYKKNKIKIYLSIVAIIFTVLIGFGVLGNIRTSNQIDKGQTQELSEIMLNLAEAKPSFVNSPVPKAYFWSYLYISSPLANLQININEQKPTYNLPSVLQYVNSELNFDFISKRIFAFFNVQKRDNTLIAPFLTVGTVYSTSYTYLGWWGMSITFLFMMGVSFCYLIIIRPQNPYFSTALAMLNTLLLFCIFDNMMNFSGMSFQLVYPILLSLKFKKVKAV